MSGRRQKWPNALQLYPLRATNAVGTSIEKVETELFQHSAAMNVQVTCDENMRRLFDSYIRTIASYAASMKKK